MSYEVLAGQKHLVKRRRHLHLVGADVITDVATVKSVQASLQLLAKATGNSAFDPKGVDGKLGPNTKSAVSAFNTAYGWPSDGGVITQGGTMTALQRPDVVRLIQGSGGPVSVVIMDNEDVTARKYVVEEVKQANVAVQAAADAKAVAVTPQEKAVAQAQADAAQKLSDKVAVDAQKAPPDVKQAADQNQAAAKMVQVASTPEQMKMAQDKAEVAGNTIAKMDTSQKVMLAVAIGIVGAFVVGGATAALWASHRLVGALVGGIVGGALLGGGGYLALASQSKGVSA